MIEGVGSLFEARALFGFVEDIGPALHGADIVDEVCRNRAGAHVEGVVELLVGELFASFVEVGVGPAVMSEKDGGGIGGLHRELLCVFHGR